MIFKSKNHDEKQKSADEKSADFLTNTYSEELDWRKKLP